MHATNDTRRAMTGGQEATMRVLVELWGSTVGRKALVALSGLLLGMWVVLHLLGNLTVFSGAATADGYAAALQRIPAWLWMARVGLAVAAVVHVAGVVSLTRASRAARPRHEVHARRRESTLAARSMRVGDALLLAFVVYHLLHLTFGVLHPGVVAGRVSGRAARLPLAATARGSRARRPDAPSPPPPPRRGRRAGRRLRRGLAVGVRLSRAVPGLPRFAQARPQRGRARWDQRREELPERRRQHRAALPRHSQGRRLPGARIERVPAGRALGAHHRSRRGTGRA